jgi:hypothetical protein
VLNAPDYTRTCTCPYQNQTSLALVHAPELDRELEIWTHHQFGVGAKEPVRLQRLGINFGAPGNRLSEQGTLWLDYPNASGSLSNIAVTVLGSHTNYFRRHVSQVSGSVLPWVTASGVSGAETILIQPAIQLLSPKSAISTNATQNADEPEREQFTKPEDISTNGLPTTATQTQPNVPSDGELNHPLSLAAAYYTVRLYFAEPEDLRPGERVFDVELQEQPVLKRFDIVAEAGRRLGGVVKEFRRVMVRDRLAIALSWSSDQTPGSILCGVEMILEKNQSGAPSPASSH